MEARKEDTLLKKLNDFATRNTEIIQAGRAYPGMEIGAAYKKWKEARGGVSDRLLSGDVDSLKKEIRSVASRLIVRQCSVPGCGGAQKLESICPGCVEGQAGYKSKWTCGACMHRDLSREDINEWLIKLSSI